MLLEVLRVHQWYKNLLIFLPLVFVERLFTPAFFSVVSGFAALCLAASSGYVINDLVDRHRDRHHSEKRDRPLPSGRLSPFLALLFAISLALVALCASFLLNPLFGSVILLFLALHLAYTFWLKHVLFLDLITLSTLFVLRALAGAFLFTPFIRISPWLVLTPFFLALFLGTAKRRSNQLFLETVAYRPLLQQYTPQLTHYLFSASTTLLVIVYALFTVFSDFPLLVITLPVVLYALFTFYTEVEQGHMMGRNLERALLHPPLLTASIIWCLLTLTIIYA